MVLTWTPQATQTGPQGFCAGAIDNNNLQSAPWCITYLVGYSSPNLIQPTFVQGSASPIGTVFANQSVFSIQATNPVGRPSRNGINVCFNDLATGVSVVCYDAGYAANILYNGYKILILTNVTWTYGHTYYVTMDSGFASGSVFCHAESAPITDPTYWQFNIWNPAVSSTTTTTPVTLTTHTVTTRTISLTTPNPSLTTTGIAVTNASVVLTVATSPSTTTQTTSTTSTATTATTTELVTDMQVITPQEMEEMCQQPVTIFTAAQLIAMLPINIAGLCILFTQVTKTSSARWIASNVRHARRLKRLAGNK